MRTTITLLALLLLATTATSQIEATIDINGESRSYTYFVPLTMPPQAYSLVFVLHGATQTGQGIMDISQMNDIATANNFIAVYPDGVGNSWNVGLTTGGSTADDIAFIEALVALFAAEFSIDQTKVYSCGFSAGGYMSHRLACESSVCFAAIASVAGAIAESALTNCSPQYSPSVMQIHGTSDIIVSYNGSAISGISVDDIIAAWLSNNNCSTTPVIEDIPNTSVIDLSTVQRFTYEPCDESSVVELLKIDGGGHQWPGTDALFGGLGNINRDIDASQEIWNFFSQFQCPSEVGIEETANENNISIYPNPATDVVNIQFENGQQPENIIIYNSQGQIVFQQNITQDQTKIQISTAALAPGIYFIQDAKVRLVVADF